MKVITGLFDAKAAAKAAVAELEEAGVLSEEISIIGYDSGEDGLEGTPSGAGMGAAIGGLLAGVGSLALLGVGPLFGAGWLIAALAGSAGAAAGGLAGGLIGSMTEAGIEERDAHVYAEAIKRGGSIVIAKVDEATLDAAASILGRHGRADLPARRAEYMAQGWTGFEPASPENAASPIVTPPPIR